MIKTTINIELNAGESLKDALQQLMGKGACVCSQDAEPPAKGAPAEAPAEEAPEEKPAPKRAKRKASAPKPEPEASEDPEKESPTETPKKPKGIPAHQAKIRSAAMAAINNGKRDEVETLLNPYGGLKGVPEEDAEDLLAKIEAL